MTWEYKCGHKSDAIIMDANALSYSAYLEWSETVGVNGTMEKCFDCWCKERA